MIPTPRALALATLAALAAALPDPAVAEEDDDQASDWEEEYAPSDLAAADPAAAPGEATPEAPPSVQVPPPPAEAEAPAAQGVPTGQWVRTEQYGWVWMPYADAYTYVPADGYGEPYMYVWAPSIGWSWLAAPWVWGFGPWPHFGVSGYVHFGWYGHGWWRTPHRWHWYHRPYHAAWGHVGGWRHDGWRHDRWRREGGGWHDRGGARGDWGHRGSATAPRPGGFVPRPGAGIRTERRDAPAFHGGARSGSFGGRGAWGGGGEGHRASSGQQVLGGGRGGSSGGHGLFGGGRAGGHPSGGHLGGGHSGGSRGGGRHR